jgi:DNA-binding GntR family transcriptional regulator
MALDDRKDRINHAGPEHLWAQVAADIRRDIKSGQLKPGDKLPNELELAAQYGVARLTIRRAIRDLTEAKPAVLVVTHGRGTYVAQR